MRGTPKIRDICYGCIPATVTRTITYGGNMPGNFLTETSTSAIYAYRNIKHMATRKKQYNKFHVWTVVLPVKG